MLVLICTHGIQTGGFSRCFFMFMCFGLSEPEENMDSPRLPFRTMVSLNNALSAPLARSEFVINCFRALESSRPLRLSRPLSYLHLVLLFKKLWTLLHYYRAIERPEQCRTKRLKIPTCMWTQARSRRGPTIPLPKYHRNSVAFNRLRGVT